MKTDVFQSQVSLPNPVTEVAGAMVQPDTQVAGALGNITGALGNIAGQYMHAKHVSDTNTANIEIQTRVNDFMENQRRSPSVRKDGETLMQARIREWDEFSEKLNTEYISKLENGQVAENLTAEWKGRSEEYKHSVVNAAIDEDIAYMSEKAKDNVTTQIALAFQSPTPEGFERADRMITEEFQAGNLSQAERDSYYATANMNKAIWDTKHGLKDPDTGEYSEPMTYQESLSYIDRTDLPAEEKGKARTYLIKEEEARVKKVVAEGLEYYQGLVYEGEYVDNPDGHELIQKDMEESHPDFSFADQEKVHAILSREQAKKDSGKEPDSDKAAYERIWLAIQKPGATRESAVEAYQKEFHLLSTKDREHLLTMLDDPDFGKERVVGNYLEEKLKELGDYFNKDDEEYLSAKKFIRDQYDLMKNVGSPQDIMSEKNFTKEDVDKLVNVAKQAELTKVIENVTLNETRGNFKQSRAETVLRAAMAGDFNGLTDRDMINLYYNSRGMEDQSFKDMYAKKTGAENWNSLSDLDKKKGMFSLNAAKISRMGAEYVEELTHQYVISTAIDPRSSMPIFTVRAPGVSGPSGDRQIRLNYDPDAKEEYLEVYDQNVGQWAPLRGVEYPDLTSDTPFVATVKQSVEAIYDAMEPEGFAEAEEALKAAGYGSNTETLPYGGLYAPQAEVEKKGSLDDDYKKMIESYKKDEPEKYWTGR